MTHASRSRPPAARRSAHGRAGSRLAASLLALGLTWTVPRDARAANATAGVGPERTSTARGRTGRPKVKLDRLSFPSIENGSYYKKHLERSLRRAVRDADWGAGSGSVIEYRFRVTRLELEHDAGVVRATCAATGELPGGRWASSEIRFGDAPAQRRELIERVLSVVARGVVTRLAEIEHRRRQGS